MSVIEDLLAEGMAERVSAIPVPASMAGTVWRRFRRRRTRRRVAGIVATVLALAGLGALVPGLLAVHGDPAQTATEPVGSPAPTALRAQLMSALNSDEAGIERETVTGAPGATGPIEYWYDPATGQSLSQALDASGQQVLAQVAALGEKTAGAPLTVTEMDFETKTWATATVSSAVAVPIPFVVPVPLTAPLPEASAAASDAAPAAAAVPSADTPAELQQVLKAGNLLVLGREVINGQDAVHLALAEPRLTPTPTQANALGPVAAPTSYELWVDPATGQPIQQVVMVGGGRIQIIYTWLAPGTVNLTSVAGVPPASFTQVTSPPVALPTPAPVPSPA